MPPSRHVMVNKSHRGSNTRQEPALLLNQPIDTTSQATVNTLSSRALLGTISSGLGHTANGLSWTPLDGGYRTTQSGGTFSIKFVGQSLIWYGFYDTSFPWAAPGTGPMAFYTIDQVDTFAFPTVPSSVTSQPKSTLSNLPLFETKTLPLGQHLLEVSFLGGSSDVPLTVINIAVSDPAGDAPSASSSPSAGGGGSSLIVSQSPSAAVTSAAPSSVISPPDSASSATPSLTSFPSSSANATISTTGSDSASLSRPGPSASPLQVSPGTTAFTPGPSSSGLTNTGTNSNLNSSAPATKNSNVGAIAGGIVAGAAVLLVLLFVLLFLRRRRRRARDAAGAVLGSSSTLRVGAGGESGRTAGGGSIVPDPFPSTRQLDLSPVTASRPYDDSGSQSVISEKARMYLEQQMLLSDPLAADWPQPMNAKHRDTRPPEAAQTASLSHQGGAAAHDDPHSPIRSPNAMRGALTSFSSSPRSPASQSMPQIPAPVPTPLPIPPSIGMPQTMGTVQDEDSGIRLMQQSDTGGFVEVLPPSYTAH